MHHGVAYVYDRLRLIARVTVDRTWRRFARSIISRKAAAVAAAAAAVEAVYNSNRCNSALRRLGLYR